MLYVIRVDTEQNTSMFLITPKQPVTNVSFCCLYTLTLSLSGTSWTAQTLTPPSLILTANHEACTAPSPSSFHPGSSPCRVRAPGLVEEAWRSAPASGSWGGTRVPSSPPPAPPAPYASRPTPSTARSQTGGAPWRRTEVTRASQPAAGGETLLIRSLRRSRDVTEPGRSSDLQLAFMCYRLVMRSLYSSWWTNQTDAHRKCLFLTLHSFAFFIQAMLSDLFSSLNWDQIRSHWSKTYNTGHNAQRTWCRVLQRPNKITKKNKSSTEKECESETLDSGLFLFKTN